MDKIKIIKLIPGGQALAELSDGKKIMLWNALPGEVATKIHITKDKNSFMEGIVEQYENASPARIQPKDDCFLATSPWQIMTYENELAEKKNLLTEILRQQKVEYNTEIADVQTDGKEFYYRNKMEYALYYANEDEKIHLAFHERGTFKKLVIEKSSLEHAEILTRAEEIINEMNFRHDEARKYQMIMLRSNQNGEVSGGAIPNFQKRPVFSELNDKILGFDYSYSPNGFFQINLPVYEMVLKEIASEIETKKVLDLYAGVGTIGLSVARDKDLTLVECNHAAYKELEKNSQNAEKKGFLRKSKIKTKLAKSEDALEFIENDQTVIIDPPRAGLDKKVLEKFLETMPPKICYLSCNPITQARDIAKIQSKYQIKKIIPYNFFPRTPHLENLIILELK